MTVKRCGRRLARRTGWVAAVLGQNPSQYPYHKKEAADISPHRLTSHGVINDELNRPDKPVRRHGVRIGSWNVGSMTGKSGEVANELWSREVDICGVQETRWKGAGARCVGPKGRRYKFWWQGGDGTGGVGVLMKEELSEGVMEVRRKNDRVIVVVVLVGKLVVRVVSAYAPQQGRSEEEKQMFYDSVEEELQLVKSNELLIMCGDWNGHVGEKADGYAGVHGGFGLGDRNEEGCRILELCDSYELIVTNTYFTRQPRQRVTYRSGEHESAIDYILVKADDRKWVKNVKVIPQQTQHGLVILDMEKPGLVKRRKMKYQPRVKIWKLREKGVCDKFKQEVVDQWNELEKEGTWEQYKDCVLKNAEKVCGWTKGKCRHGETWWWKEEVREAIDKKREAFKQMRANKNDGTMQVYKESKKEAKKAVAKAMAEEANNVMDDIQQDKSLKRLFRVAKQISREQTDVVGSKSIKDQQGRLCIEEEEIAEVLKVHMEGVMNVENTWDGIVEAAAVEGPVLSITREEVKAALKDLKYGKAGGVSGVLAEHIRGSGDVGVEVITRICNEVLDGKKMPEDWLSSVLVPLYKGKGDVRECGSYRGVKLLEHAMKVLERVVEKRLRATVQVDDMQCGFMPGKGTTDAIFMVRMLQEKYARKKKKLYYCFVDLEKAFDRVPRRVIEWALRVKGVEEWLVAAVMQMYEGAKTRVRVGSALSDEFEVKVGVHQGSVLSPFLFAIVMDVVCGSAMEGLVFEILYADDLVLMAESMEELQAKFNKWKEAIEKKGMKVNVTKTKCLVSGEGSGKKEISKIDPCAVCGSRVGRNSILCTVCNFWVHKRCSGVKGQLARVKGSFRCKSCIGDEIVDKRIEPREEMEGGVEMVDNFVYLGDCIDAAGGCSRAIVGRVRSGWKKFRELSGVLCGKRWSLKMKGTVYKTCVRTVMIYGGETWAMRKEDEAVLRRAERAMIRRMCGVRLRDRKRSVDLQRMMGVDEDIVTIVVRSRLRWYGHVKRRDEDSGIRRVLEMEVSGAMPRGRPKLDWEGLVKRNLKDYGLNERDCWDRDKWRVGVSHVGTNRQPL